MALTSDLLSQLADIEMPAESYRRVLKLLAQVQADDEARRAGQRERTRKSRERRDGNVTVASGSQPSNGTVTAPVSPEVSPKDITQTPILAPSGERTSERASAAPHWPKDAYRQFYDLYPRKKAPADAEKAFRQVERTCGLTFAAFMAALRRYVDSDPEPKFIPYPASWLRSGQYLDEPDPPPRQNGPSNVHRPRHDQPVKADRRLAAMADVIGGGDEHELPADDPGEPGADAEPAWRGRGNEPGLRRLAPPRHEAGAWNGGHAAAGRLSG